MNKKHAIIILLVCVVFIGGVAAVSLLSSQQGWSWNWNWDWLGFGGQRVEIDESADISTQGVSQVDIALPCGNVIVEEGNPGVTIKGYITVSEEKDRYLFVKNEGGKLSIEFDPGDLPPARNSNITMTVRLPREIAADIKLVDSSGNIHINAIAAQDFTVMNMSGNMEISGCSGGALKAELSSGNMTVKGADFESVEADCQSGNIRIENQNGPIDVSNMSGNINITAVSGKIKAHCASGNVDIMLSGKEISGIDASVSSGNLNVFLDTEAAFALDARTSSGRVTCGFDILVNGNSDRNSLKGDCNGGGEKVKLSVGSGNVNVHKS